MKRIKLLEKNLINQIAAGEVIERPASVVKELVENSIDAGATRIEVEISNETRDIRVADNGSGIHKDDIVLAFSRHATSKIKETNDLWNISTLGFRGEALASIISVSKITCYSRTADSETGTKVECSNSEVKTSETGCAIGTIMEVKDLFYNTPARMKFLKKHQTELASITEILQGIAIAHPEVAINLVHKNHSSLKTSGSNDLATTISEIYSKELIKELSEIQNEDKEFKLKIQGYTSNPDFTRSNKKAVYLFINGRTVKCPIILKAVDTAYKDIIPSGRYPFAVLNLTIANSDIDVNVHPAKREVRYSNSNQIFNFVLSSIKRALENSNIYPSTFKSNNEENSPVNIASYRPSTGFSTKSSFAPVKPAFEKVNFDNLKEQKEKSLEFYSPVQSKIEFKEEVVEVYKEKIKIVGQFLNTYILIETDEGLQIVDQHIAHERAIYEKLKTTKNYASQLLIASDIIELEPIQISLIEENQEILSKYGYEFQKIDEKSITLRQIPQILVGKKPESIISDILEALESSIDSIEDNILITTSCHAAVKANEKLSIWQMEELIKDWMNTKNNMTCPHGRIISHTLPTKEIASFFGRQSG